MYVYCLEMYTYHVHSVYILHRSVCPLLVYSHRLYRMMLSIPRKYTVLNESFVFDLCDIFQEYNSGIKQDLPVVYFWLQYV